MYIRIKTSPNSPKKAVQIVQSVRTGKKVSQRIVRHVGSALNEIEIIKLKEVAEYILATIQTEKQPSFFPPEELAEMAIASRRKQRDEAKKEEEKKEEEEKIILKNIREDQRLILGIHEICGDIYNEIGFDSVLGNPKRKVTDSKVLKNLVMARIANPSSKRESVRVLEKNFGVHIDLSRVYRVMDKIGYREIEKIQKISYQFAKTLYSGKVNILFYDCTTLYFESFEDYDENEVLQKGFSKDAKFNQNQVILAFLVTEGGIPIGYDVYPGDLFEGNTLPNVITKIKETYQLDKVIFVADAAMISNDHIKLLQKMNQPYIIAARLKNLTDAMQNQVLQKSNYKNIKENIESKKIAEFQYKTEEKIRLIVTYSSKRAVKDKYDRDKAIKQIIKRLEKGKQVKNFLNNYGYKRYLKLEGESKVAIDEKKLEQASQWDGLHGIITNIEEMKATDAVAHYHDLWQIEETFRITKHDLSIRPIYHWTSKRIRAHIAMCYIALVCMRALAHRVSVQYQKLSIAEIIKILLDVQVSVIKDLKTQKKHAIPSKITQEIKKIYQVMGRKITDQPFTIR